MLTQHKEVIQAPYRFTRDEIDLMNTQLRYNLANIEALEDQKKTTTQDFNLRIQNCENSVKMLRCKLDTGEETRSVEAIVEFAAGTGTKYFIHPITRALIREEPMQPADWQLPMFRQADNGNLEPVPPVYATDDAVPDLSNVPEMPTEPLETNLGTVLDQAAAATEAPQILLDLTKDDWDSAGLSRAFKRAAKKANWSPAQVSLMFDRLKECDTVAAMLDTLRPHTLAGQPATEPEADEDPTEL